MGAVLLLSKLGSIKVEEQTWSIFSVTLSRFTVFEKELWKKNYLRTSNTKFYQNYPIGYSIMRLHSIKSVLINYL
jgi:aspartyl/asparaginyl beta-hydroxylase (cupin superfamily)